jgi:hypothetical protein
VKIRLAYPHRLDLVHLLSFCHRVYFWSLQKWFLAISLVINVKKGIASRQLGRDLLVTKDTAWRILMQIRKAMYEYGDLLQGIIESEES